MLINTNVPLKSYTTMQVGGNARFVADASSVDELRELLESAEEKHLPVFILGGGSNTIALDEDFEGFVIRNRIKGDEVLDDNPETATIRVGAGENWDETVKKTVDAELQGIEALSAIPGTVGASPVQNIGAYGQEVADVIVSVEAYDMIDRSLKTLSSEECGFSYRHSIFRGDAAGRYCITSVTMQLNKQAPRPPFYAAVERYFAEHGAPAVYTVEAIRQAVTAIRADKLPDPVERPNAGSFFKNAVIDEWLYTELIKQFPDMPSYEMAENRYKIPTGWLIEQCSFKGQLLHGIRVHPGNCLVLVNESADSYDNLQLARDEIVNAVRDRFRISIEQEPLLLTSPTS